MNEKLTLEELAIFVNRETKTNESLYSSSISDSRKKNEFSARRIRDLISKKMISSGFKDGRHVFYNQNHIDELLKYKAMQALGYTENTIKLQKNSLLAEKNSLSSAILSIEEKSLRKTNDSKFISSSSSVSELLLNKNLTLDFKLDSQLYSLDKTTKDIPIIETKVYKLSENISLTITNNIDKSEFNNLDEIIKKIIKIYK
jgi:hypothetical protein